MTRRLPYFLLPLLLLPAAASGQAGDPDLAVRARAATQVIVGTVLGVTSRMGTNAAGDRLIYSDLQIDVSETLKGSSSEVLIVTVEGGEVDGLTLKVSDMPTPRQGDRAIYFLARDSRGDWRPSGRGLGIVPVDAGGRLENSQLALADARAFILGGR